MNSVVPNPSGLGRHQVLTLQTLGLQPLRLQAQRGEGRTELVSEYTPKDAEIAVGSRRVLVIEDHADTAEAIAVCLRAARHRVELAGDGEAGLALARRFNPEVVFCDIWLPGVDGYYVTRALKKDPSMATCYFVAMSGVPFGRPGIGVGFNEYLLKPIDGDVLLAVMSRASGH